MASLVAGDGKKGKAQLELWERCVCMVRATVTYLCGATAGQSLLLGSHREAAAALEAVALEPAPHQTDQRRRA